MPGMMWWFTTKNTAPVVRSWSWTHWIQRGPILVPDGPFSIRSTSNSFTTSWARILYLEAL